MTDIKMSKFEWRLWQIAAWSLIIILVSCLWFITSKYDKLEQKSKEQFNAGYNQCFDELVLPINTETNGTNKPTPWRNFYP